MPPASPAAEPALRTWGATLSRSATSSRSDEAAGMSAGSDGVNAGGAAPPEPTFSSAGSSALWIRIAAPFWVGVSEIATPWSAGW